MMRIAVYRDRCTGGHVQRHPFSRNLAIIWGTRTLSFRVRYVTVRYGGYICGRCYDL